MKKTLNNEQNEVLDRIRNGDESVIDEIYEAYRGTFLDWACKYFSIKEEQAVDVFQDTIVEIYLNVLNGKLTSLTSSFKTYFFSVGKNCLFHRMRKDNKFQLKDSVVDFYEEDEPVERDFEPFEENKKDVFELVNEMGEPCKSMLEKFYLHNMNMESIAKYIGYKNANVAKSKKKRCLDYLRKQLLNQ